MRLSGALVLLAACGNAARPASPRVAITVDAAPAAAAKSPDAERSRADDLGIDWGNVPHATDDDALAIWARMGLDGDNWQERLSDIPDNADDLRAAMAKALLREGNFACPPVDLPAACGQVDREFPEVTAKDHLDNPCLRRLVAQWALDQIDSDDAETQLIPDMIALAGLPPPEDTLNRAALAMVDDEKLRLQMLDAAERAGNQQVADDNLGHLSNAAMATAALQLHVDGALEALDPGDSLDVYTEALDKPGLRRDTRVQAARAITELAASLDPKDPARDTVLAALRTASGDSDCAIAAAATAGVSELTGRPFALPDKRASDTDLVRAMCIALLGESDPSPLWHTIVGAKGLVSRDLYDDPDRVAKLWADNPDAPDANHDGVPDVPEADADGDGNPKTWAEVTHVDRDDLADVPHLDEIVTSLPACKGTVCAVPGADVTIKFLFKKVGGRLVLDTIERHETVHDC